MRVPCSVSALLLGVALLSSCGYYHEDFTKKSGAGIGNVNRNFTKLNFESVREIVFKGNCRDCHFPDTKIKKGIDLSDYNLVVSKIDKIRSEIVSGDMPPPDEGLDPVPKAQQDILIAWIEAREPLDSDIDLPAPKTTATEFDDKDSFFGEEE
jgi:hypothetical protein